MRITLILLSFFTSIVSAQMPDFDATESSAKQGNATSQYYLGTMYYIGQGAPKNDLEAAKWFRLAAEQGLANAQHNLGVMYDNGEGVPENDLKAVEWFRLAAQQGVVDSQLNLGVMYQRGDGVPENYLVAYVWYSVSAAQGDENAKIGLEMVKSLLSKEQIAQGQTLALKCFDSNFKDCP